MTKKNMPWDTPGPKGPSKKMTPEQKAKARARAKAAGRVYPNLVDNMAVAKTSKRNKR